MENNFLKKYFIKSTVIQIYLLYLQGLLFLSNLFTFLKIQYYHSINRTISYIEYNFTIPNHIVFLFVIINLIIIVIHNIKKNNISQITISLILFIYFMYFKYNIIFAIFIYILTIISYQKDLKNNLT